jgi:nucleoside-diphosphate-sugar epimerase
VLVVGGSRGLGEVAVRLLAAGGADVRFTWCAGAADAARVAGATGARAERWCAPDDEIEHLVAFAAEPTHVCWFASPPWPADPTATDVEITAFAHAVAAFAAHGLVGALWPSTDLLDVAPDDRPLGSDAWADRKAAGEAVCGRLAGAHPGLGVRIARLPILLTDRTRTLLPREYGDTADELLAALRQLPPAAP